LTVPPAHSRASKARERAERKAARENVAGNARAGRGENTAGSSAGAGRWWEAMAREAARIDFVAL